MRADLLTNHGQETLTYFASPSNHWRQIKTNNPLERIIREIRRRRRVVGAFPDGHSEVLRTPDAEIIGAGDSNS